MSFYSLYVFILSISFCTSGSDAHLSVGPKHSILHKRQGRASVTPNTLKGEHVSFVYGTYFAFTSVIWRQFGGFFGRIIMPYKPKVKILHRRNKLAQLEGARSMKRGKEDILDECMHGRRRY